MGSKGKGREIQPGSVKVGDKVLPEYGGTKVLLDDKDYFLFRDGDILGKYVDGNKSLLKWHALAGVAQWIEWRPVNHRVAS